jgi:hypothetical protein
MKTSWPISGIHLGGKYMPLSHAKALRKIVDAPWYVQDTVNRRDLQTPTVKEEIHRYSSQYSARHSEHPNDLIVNLTELKKKKLN